MKSIRTLAIILAVIAVNVSTSTATTTPGNVNDGKYSISYVSTTGQMIVQPDGQPVGFFEITSASGILRTSAVFPPNAIDTTLTPNEIQWAALPSNAFITDHSLGFVASSGLSLDFLLNDLVLLAGGGFGHPTFDADLVYTIPEPGTALICVIAVVCALFHRQRHR